MFASAWLLLAVVAVLVPALLPLWKWLGRGRGRGLQLVDAVWVWRFRPIGIRRRLPGRFA